MSDLFETEGQIRSLSGSMDDVSSAARQVAEQFKQARLATMALGGSAVSTQQLFNKLIAEFEAAGRVNPKLVLGLRAQVVELEKLNRQVKGVEIALKAFGAVSKPFSEYLLNLPSAAARASSGLKNLGTSMLGLKLSHSELIETALKFNRTMFDTARISERYGESVLSIEGSLARVQRSTTLTQQGFAELANNIKQNYVGIPPTTRAIAELAETMTGRLGYAQEEIIDGFKKLLDIQGKIPDIFDRVTQAQKAYEVSAESGAAAAGRLYTVLKSFGATKQELNAVMNAIQPPSSASRRYLELDKSISKSRQSLQDAQLEMSQKMAPALAEVERLQSLAAKSVSGFSANWLNAIGILATAEGMIVKVTAALSGMATVASLAGAAASKSAMQVAAGSQMAASKASGSLIPKAPDYVQGPGGKWVLGTSEASSKAATGFGSKIGKIGSKIGSSVAGKGIAIAGIGGLAASIAGGAIEATAPEGEPISPGRRALAQGLKWGGTGAMFGAMLGPQGAAIGAAIGGTAGGIYGWIKGLNEAKERMEEIDKSIGEQAVNLSKEMGGQLKASGYGQDVDEIMKASEGIKNSTEKAAFMKERMLVLVKNEANETKRSQVISSLILNGLVKRKDLETILVRQGREQKDIQTQINDAFKDAARSQLGLSNNVQMVTEAMTQQIAILEMQKRVLQETREGWPEYGKQIAKEGLIGGEAAKKAISSVNALARGEYKNTAAQFAASLTTAAAAMENIKGDKDFSGLDPEDQKAALETARQVERILQSTKKAPKISGATDDQISLLGTQLGILTKAKQEFEGLVKGKGGKVEDLLVSDDTVKASKERLDKIQATYDALSESITKPLTQEIISKQQKGDITDLYQMTNESTRAMALLDEKIEKAPAGSKRREWLEKYKESVMAPVKDISVLGKAMVQSGLEQTRKEVEGITAARGQDLTFAKQSISINERNLELSKSLGMGGGPSYDATVKTVSAYSQQADILADISNKMEEGLITQLKGVGLNIRNLNMFRMMEDPAGMLKQLAKDTGMEWEKVSGILGDVQIRVSNLAENELQRKETLSKSLELTRQFREGYLDALTSQAANAGKFTALFATQTKNIPQLMRMGAPSTQRYGGTNVRDVSRDQTLTTAPQFTNVYGEMTEDIRQATGLWKFSDVGVGRPVRLEDWYDVNKRQEENLRRQRSVERAQSGLDYVSTSDMGRAWIEPVTARAAAIKSAGKPSLPMRSDTRVNDKTMQEGAKWNAYGPDSAYVGDILTGVEDRFTESSIKNERAAKMQLDAAQTQISAVKGQPVTTRATGGLVQSGEYVVNTKSAQSNKDLLSSIPGVRWVNAGKPGDDDAASNFYRIAGNAGSGGVVMMNGEAILPKSYSGFGASINEMADGGIIEDIQFAKEGRKIHGRGKKKVVPSDSNPDKKLVSKYAAKNIKIAKDVMASLQSSGLSWVFDKEWGTKTKLTPKMIIDSYQSAMANESIPQEYRDKVRGMVETAKDPNRSKNVRIAKKALANIQKSGLSWVFDKEWGESTKLTPDVLIKSYQSAMANESIPKEYRDQVRDIVQMAKNPKRSIPKGSYVVQAPVARGLGGGIGHEVPNYGRMDGDSVIYHTEGGLVALQPGERVLSPRMASIGGLINNGQISKMSTGGPIGTPSLDFKAMEDMTPADKTSSPSQADVSGQSFDLSDDAKQFFKLMTTSTRFGMRK